MRPAIKPKNVLSDKIPRILADVLSLSTGISLGFLAYFMGFVVLWNRTPNSGQILDVFRVQCFQNILLSMFVGLIIFELFGFYAHTRTYQNKYKFLVIINAVTVTFAVEVLLYSYVLRLGAVPRGVMLLAWLFSLVLIAGSRAIKMYVTTSYSIEKKVVGEKKEIQQCSGDRWSRVYRIGAHAATFGKRIQSTGDGLVVFWRRLRTGTAEQSQFRTASRRLSPRGDRW